MKNQKGVTLIALIVTIIVLLILAMVSVTLILRENLITKSQTAKNEYQDAAAAEKSELDAYDKQVNDVYDELQAQKTQSPS